MSTKATAFTIDELLRPDPHTRADRCYNNVDLRQQKKVHETTRSETAECRPRGSTGRSRLPHLLMTFILGLDNLTPSSELDRIFSES